LTFTTRTIFTSKTNVLKLLNNQLHFSKIEKIFHFTHAEWLQNKSKILNQIPNVFSKQKIIVRSSALGEDSIETSQAGIYESILNVNPNSKSQLTMAINSVIASYNEKQNNNLENQILIQTQAKNISISGVCFTKTPDLGSPYYVINYDEGESTTGVTDGLVNQTIKILRTSEHKFLEKKWILLLRSIREIESILKFDRLDIEFGITKNNKIIIFQVRPITSIVKPLSQKTTLKINQTISKNIKKFEKLDSIQNIPGKPLIFSDMADWNPAEIIGNNPNPLAYSLYDFLIMKDAWYKGRIIAGYKKFDSHSLMEKFGNKPYVNTKISFYSLIPNTLNKSLTKKLMNFYLHKLQYNPQLHDKIEFEILFTCYDFSLSDRLQELRNFNFSQQEIKKIYDTLFEFTKNLIDEFPTMTSKCNNSITQMSTNRLSHMKKISESSNYIEKLEMAKVLLHECKSLGIIPFSLMARMAFIANAFLTSFVSKNYLSKKSLDEFMNSLNTPLSNFQNDLIEYCDGNITKKQFLNEYGHLRPGTYDITIDRYDQENPFLNDINFQHLSTSDFKISFLKKIKQFLILNNFKISPSLFLSFLRNSIILREKLKFEFTHNMSDALELISSAGRELGFSKEEISYLEISNIFSYKKFSKSSLKSFWKKKIKENKRRTELNNFLVLSPILSSKDDFNLIQYHSSRPNYITTKSISYQIVNLDIQKHVQNLENKIILLEHADPGFDWIFTRNPAGLITKYGGVASHMSIRCSEVNLPAAIGCGEIIYDYLKDASKVMLDCKNQQIIVLEHKKPDEYSEQKKILKSLGYIK
jgi:glutamine kinase